MRQYDFIFSDQPRYRFARHAAFWTAWFLFFSLLYAATPIPSQLSYLARLPNYLLDSLIYLTAHIFLSYSLMYIVMPRYLLKSRYVGTALGVLIMFVAAASYSAFLSVYVIREARELLIPPALQMRVHPGAANSFYSSLLAGLRGGITVAGLATAIKLMKHWHLKEQRNLQLQKENAESQLQLLKAQVHPHFLFNTLNNIYSYTQNTSPVASELIMGLSEMLRYILYEGSNARVPLSRELRMLEEYMTLEGIRYGNKLDLHTEVPHDTDGLLIAPLLLLPFVENCFKHGTSNMLEQPWLNVQIQVVRQSLTMKLMNGKARGKDFQTTEDRSGIGIANARKRLELLYPGRYELQINDDDDVFIVTLKLELDNIAPAAAPFRQPHTAVVHA